MNAINKRCVEVMNLLKNIYLQQLVIDKIPEVDTKKSVRRNEPDQYFQSIPVNTRRPFAIE